MERIIDEEITWRVMLSGDLLTCCEEAKKAGFYVEKRIGDGFLLHLPSSPTYVALVPWVDKNNRNDISSWELIRFNNRPSDEHPRILYSRGIDR